MKIMFVYIPRVSFSDFVDWLLRGGAKVVLNLYAHLIFPLPFGI